MNFSNLFLGDHTTRELLNQIDALSKESKFTKEAVELYGEISLRKAFNLPCNKSAGELVALCKAEIQEQNPTLTQTELDAMTKARIQSIQELCDKLVTRMKAIGDIFIDRYEKEFMARWEKAFVERFSDAAIDQIIEKKLATRSEALQKAVGKQLYGDELLHKSELQRFFQNRKELKAGEVS